MKHPPSPFAYSNPKRCAGIRRPHRISPHAPPGLKQCRAKGWENEVAPELSPATDPVRLPNSSEQEIKNAKIEAMVKRREAKQELWHSLDAVNPMPDYCGNLLVLARFMKDRALKARGLRSAAHGVTPHKNGFRVQFWSKIHAKHVQIGYSETEAGAWRMVEEYYRDELNIDIRVERPEWLDEMMRLAVDLQSQMRAAERERISRLWVGDDDSIPDPTGRSLSPAEETVRETLCTFGYARPLTSEEVVKHSEADPGAMATALAQLVMRGEHYAFKTVAGGREWYSASRTDYERQLRGMMRMIGG